jgi:hypothetical protein
MQEETLVHSGTLKTVKFN